MQMRGASLVLGQHGGALANILFAPQDAGPSSEGICSLVTKCVAWPLNDSVCAIASTVSQTDAEQQHTVPRFEGCVEGDRSFPPLFAH